MAYAMTYNNLVTDIQSYLERTDTATVDRIPTFIGLAEQDIAAKLKFLGNLTVQTSTMVQGNPIIDKPARWRKTVSMNLTVSGKRYPILLRKYEYLREYWPTASSTDVPKFYCVYDYTHWLVAPTPSSAFSYEVLYYERVVPLDSANQTNWFTVYAPQALLYGSLLQAMPFLKNDERMPLWQAQYDQFMQILITEDKLRLADRQAIAMDS